MSGWVEDVIRHWGYLGVLLLMFLENVFPPIPSELVMPLAGYASDGVGLSFWGVVAAGMTGSVAGAVVLYALGRWVGIERLERWVAGHGHWILLSEKELRRAQGWFDRHGYATVFFARLVPGVRSLISIPAGMCRMHPVPFLLWTAAGTWLWAAILALGGRYLEDRHEVVGRYLGPASWIVLGGLVLWYVVYAWTHHRRKRRRLR